MSRMRSRIGLGALAGFTVLVTLGCTATVTPAATLSATDFATGGPMVPVSASAGLPSPAASASAAGFSSAAPFQSAGASISGSVGIARLIVLANGVDGGVGLWTLDAASKWVALAATPGATALGRTAGGIAIATGHEVDLRSGSNLPHAGTVRTLKWSGTAPAAPIAGLDGSPAGKLAFVTAGDAGVGYALAAADGTVTALSPAPTQSFTPQVAWLDEARLLVPATDNMQISRLAVVDTAAHVLTPSATMLGLRVFGLSANRQTLAASTEDAVYAGPVARFLGGTMPERAVTLADFQVIWALTLDATGTHMYLLSGTEAPDGTLGSFRELGYARQGSVWTKVLDAPAPFTRAIAQVCLS